MNLGLITHQERRDRFEVEYTGRGHHVVYSPPTIHGNEDMSKCEAIFVCLRIKTNPDGSQDLKELKDSLKKYQRLDRTPFFLVCNLLPKTTDHLRKFYKMRLYAAYFDRFGCEDDPIALDTQSNLLKAILGKDCVLRSNREVELEYFIEVLLDAHARHLDSVIKKYGERLIVARSHEGKPGFGGEQLEDMQALIKELKRLGLQTGSLDCMMYENFCYRAHWDKDIRPPQIVFPENINQMRDL